MNTQHVLKVISFGMKSDFLPIEHPVGCTTNILSDLQKEVNKTRNTVISLCSQSRKKKAIN